MLWTQKKPYRWGCLPTAFANTLCVSYDTLITIVGHDGSEIIRPDKEEPLNRRGFHPQELVDAVLKMGHVPVFLADYPMGVEENKPDVWLGKARLVKHLTTAGNTGVVESRAPGGSAHALSFESHDETVDFVDPDTGQLHTHAKNAVLSNNILAVWLIK